MTTRQSEHGPQIKKIIARRDSRGLVFEPVQAAELAVQRNCHAVMTLPGEVRGNHFHRVGTEILTVCGEAWVRLKTSGDIEDYYSKEEEVWQFTLPPGVAHAIKNTGRQPHWLVAFNSYPHSQENPDVVREVLIEE